MPLDTSQMDLLDSPEFINDEFGPNFKYIKALFYGDYGVGKTVLASSFGETLFLAADPGWVSATNHKGTRENVTPVQYRGYKHFNALTIALAERVKTKTRDFGAYKTFVIDTLDEIVADVIDSVVEGYDRGKGNDRPEFDARVGALPARKTLPDFDVAGRTDYHVVRNLLRGPLRRLMSAPVNVIILTHEREPTEEEKKKKDTLKILRPSLTDSVYKVVANHAHLLGHMTREGEVRKISFIRDRTVAGKSRIAELDGKTILAEQLPKFVARWQNLDPDFYNTDYSLSTG
jgi:GTPase SAR1 family protein